MSEDSCWIFEDGTEKSKDLGRIRKLCTADLMRLRDGAVKVLNQRFRDHVRGEKVS